MDEVKEPRGPPVERDIKDAHTQRGVVFGHYIHAYHFPAIPLENGPHGPCPRTEFQQPHHPFEGQRSLLRDRFARHNCANVGRHKLRERWGGGGEVTQTENMSTAPSTTPRVDGGF